MPGSIGSIAAFEVILITAQPHPLNLSRAVNTTESVAAETIQNLEVKTAELQNQLYALNAIFRDEKTSTHEHIDKAIDLSTEQKTS